MSIDFLLDRFAEAPETPALVWRDQTVSYAELASGVNEASRWLVDQCLPHDAVVSLEADYSPTAVALLLALIHHGVTVVPLTESVDAKKPRFREVAEVEHRVLLDDADEPSLVSTGETASHELYGTLRGRKHPGLILFSSGSTGESKAALHDFQDLLAKFETRRPSLCTLVFLLFDHIGGVNTLLHTLSNLGCVVTIEDRAPDAVCAAIERHRVALLPTSPTFLNLMLLSGACGRHDLSSLRTITYGTEPMAEATLARLHEVLPEVRLQQTYGLSEVGILRSKSKASDSLWVRIGGEGFETRVVDGLLEIKARSAMLGYLNAPSPFTDDGWFKTGDSVAVNGEFFRIFGRASEMINVGGQKVYPAEVEGVLSRMDGVEDVTVSGESNPITGQLVKARVKLSTDEPLREFRGRMRRFCRERLEQFQIPQKVVLVDEVLYGSRYKRLRRE